MTIIFRYTNETANTNKSDINENLRLIMRVFTTDDGVWIYEQIDGYTNKSDKVNEIRHEKL